MLSFEVIEGVEGPGRGRAENADQQSSLFTVKRS